jgi:biotin carboxylase
VLLLLPTTTYKVTAFLEAAARLGIDVVVGSDRRQALADHAPGRTLALDFLDPEAAAAAIAAFARERPLDAIVPADDETTVLAAMASAVLGLPGNSAASARATVDKGEMRKLLAAAGVTQPEFRLLSLDSRDDDSSGVPGLAEPPGPAGSPGPRGMDLGFPVVAKPLTLSASRGVIRADSPVELEEAIRRIEAILRTPEVERKAGPAARRILVERFVPGAEVAVEGLLTAGALDVLALFDKPDPLDGPYFEETIYVTPSRLAAPLQRRIAECTQAAAAAIGLRTGPVHAELRLSGGSEPRLIEIAARTIGGLCSRTLRFGAGISLEELVLGHAIDPEGARSGLPARDGQAAGVMMIPIPRTGILVEVSGLEAARAVAGIEDVVITIPRGQALVTLPEGDRYLGFLFARGRTPGAVESALRESHALLGFTIG